MSAAAPVPPVPASSATAPPAEARDTGATGARFALIGWVAFVLLVVYAVLIGGGWAGIHLVSLRMISLLLVAVGLGAWLALGLRHRGWRPSTSIWPTLVLPIIVLLLATATSWMPRLGLEYVAWAVLLVALYLLLVRVLAYAPVRARLGALAAMLSLVVGLLYMGQVLLAWMEWWDLVGGPAVPPLRPLYSGLSLGGPGTVASVQVLSTAIAIAALGLADRRRQLLAGVLVAITAAVVLVTASRSGWLALAGALALTTLLWLALAVRGGSLRDRARRAWARRDVRIGVVVVTIGAVALVLLLGPLLLDRLLGSGTGGRGQYFTVALRMFADAPLLGQGPGTWAVRRVTYTEAGELDHYIPHAHDVYLQTLAELGLVGAVLGLLALVPVAWLVWRALRVHDPDLRRWAWAAVFVLPFFGLFNVFDFQLNVPAVMLLAVLPVAWLDASTAEGIGIGRAVPAVAAWVGRGAQVVLWLGALGAVLVLARVESVAMTHEQAVAAVYTADWEAAGAPAEEANKADPEYAAYAITRGLVASAEADWETAADVYRFAAETDDMAQSWLGLAQAQAALGQPEADVVESIEQALRIGRQQPSVVFAAGHLYDRLGLTEQADELYAATLARYPSLAADPYWGGLAGGEDRFAAIVEAAEALAPGQGWEIALVGGDTERARTLAPTGLQQAITEAWSGDAEALVDVYAAADATSDSTYVLAWASRLASREGDDERAARYQRLAVYGLIEGGELPGTEIAIDEDGWLEAVPAGTKVGFAGHYLYRRPLGPDLLPPGLPRLVFAEREQTTEPDPAEPHSARPSVPLPERTTVH